MWSDKAWLVIFISLDDKMIVIIKMFAIYHEVCLTAKLCRDNTQLISLRQLNPNADIQIIDLKHYPQPFVGYLIGAQKDL